MKEVSLNNVAKSNEKEILRYLDSCRELALLVKSLLLWKQPSYPVAILAFITTLFIMMRDVEVITGLCGVGLVAVVLDYSLPRVCGRVWSPEDWTSTKQAELEAMSRSIADSLHFTTMLIQRLSQAKASSPLLYYMTVVPTLFILGWLGSLINNLFITYLLVVGVVMLPGLHHRGLVVKYYEMMLDSILHLLKSFTARSPVHNKTN